MSDWHVRLMFDPKYEGGTWTATADQGTLAMYDGSGRTPLDAMTDLAMTLCEALEGQA